MTWFNYSIIKYMPDPKRGEIINVGIVVFRQCGIDVRLLQTASKIRIFDNNTEINDLEKYQSSLQQITSHIDDPEQQYKTLKLFSGSLFLSDKGMFDLADNENYEQRVSSLFATLVKPFSGRENKVHQSRLFTRIKKRFESMEILSTDSNEINNHKIIPSFPLGDNSGFTADFMLKNGRFHMTEVIDFNVNDTQAKFKETTFKVMSFMQGRKVLAQDMACYFAYTASSSKEAEIQQHLAVAEQHCDRMFNLESRQDESSYFQLLQTFAGHSLDLTH